MFRGSFPAPRHGHWMDEIRSSGSRALRVGRQHSKFEEWDRGTSEERKKDVYSQRKGKDIYVHELEVSPECAEYEIEFRG